jgi:hypothetical protein
MISLIILSEAKRSFVCVALEERTLRDVSTSLGMTKGVTTWLQPNEQ